MSYTPVFGAAVVNPANVSYRNFALTADVTLEWASAFVNGSNVVADIMDITPDTSGWSITLPDATQTGQGTSFIAINDGADTFSILDAGGNSLLTLASGEAWHFRLEDNTTTAGTWGTLQFGAGSSSANAASLAGYGLKVLSGTLNLNHEIQAKNATYSVATSDRASTLLWSGGAGTFNLLTAASAATGFFFLVRNGGSGNLTIDPAGAETIDGASTATLAPSESCFVVTDGSAWYTIGQGRSIVNTITRLTLNLGALSSPYSETASQAANQVQEYTGALAASFTIYMPATVAIYYVFNNTTGSQDVVVQTASGTGVTVANGTHQILYCDGTNIDVALDAGNGTVTQISTGTGLTGGPITTSGTVSLSVPMQLANGTASAPTYGFATTSGVGMFYNGTVLGLAVNSVSSLLVGAGGSTQSGTLSITGQVRAASGSAATPAYSFSSDQDTGAYIAGPNQIGLTLSGVSRVLFGDGAGATYNTYLGTTVSNETVIVRVASGRTSNGATLLDLVGDTTYTTYGTRLGRNPGANGQSFLTHRGTNSLLLQTEDGGSIIVSTSANQRVEVNSTGQVGIGVGASTAATLTVSGNIISTSAVATSSLFRFADGTTQSTAAPRSKEFVSTNQNFTASTIISLAHLLGRQPIGVQAYAVAKAAAPGGYTSGTEVQIDYGNWAGNNTGISVVTDTTSVIVRIASSAGVSLNLPHATTLTYTTLDIADFWLKIRAWTLS